MTPPRGISLTGPEVATFRRSLLLERAEERRDVH